MSANQPHQTRPSGIVPTGSPSGGNMMPNPQNNLHSIQNVPSFNTNIPFTMLEPEQALQKFDEMKATVEQMREDIRQLLRTAGTFVSSKATQNSLVNQSKIMGERMRKLSTLGKELEGYIRPIPNEGNLIDESVVKLISQVEDENISSIKSRGKKVSSSLDQIFVSSPFVRKEKRKTDSNSEENPNKKSAKPLMSISQNVEHVSQQLKQKQSLLTIKKMEEVPDNQTQGKKGKVTGIKFRCGKYLKGIVSFVPSALLGKEQRLVLDKVSLFGYGEKNKKDVSERSEFRIIQRLSEVAREAILFFERKHPNQSLLPFLLWVDSCKQAFISKCSKCDKVLEYSSKFGFIPPSTVPFDELGEIYHEKCNRKNVVE